MKQFNLLSFCYSLSNLKMGVYYLNVGRVTCLYLKFFIKKTSGINQWVYVAGLQGVRQISFPSFLLLGEGQDEAIKRDICRTPGLHEITFYTDK